MPRRTTTTAVSVAALAVLALGLSACSSGSSPAKSGVAATTASAVNAADLVSQATKATTRIKSAHLSVTSVLSGKTSVLSGDVSYDPTKLDMSIDAGGGVKLQEVLVGNYIYVKLPAGAGAGHKPWASISLKQISKTSGLDLSSLLDNSSPDQTVKLLTKSNDLKYVGTDTVDGVSTRHLAGTVDLAATYPTLDAASQKTLTSLVKDLDVKNVHIDLWVNAQQIPVKVVESYTSKMGQGSSTMVLSALNAPVTITAPPASQVASLL
jgi:hypothetical protein